MRKAALTSQDTLEESLTPSQSNTPTKKEKKQKKEKKPKKDKKKDKDKDKDKRKKDDVVVPAAISQSPTNDDAIKLKEETSAIKEPEKKQDTTKEYKKEEQTSVKIDLAQKCMPTSGIVTGGKEQENQVPFIQETSAHAGPTNSRDVDEVVVEASPPQPQPRVEVADKQQPPVHREHHNQHLEGDLGSDDHESDNDATSSKGMKFKISSYSEYRPVARKSANILSKIQLFDSDPEFSKRMFEQRKRMFEGPRPYIRPNFEKSSFENSRSVKEKSPVRIGSRYPKVRELTLDYTNDEITTSPNSPIAISVISDTAADSKKNSTPVMSPKFSKKRPDYRGNTKFSAQSVASSNANIVQISPGRNKASNNFHPPKNSSPSPQFSTFKPSPLAKSHASSTARLKESFLKGDRSSSFNSKSPTYVKVFPSSKNGVSETDMRKKSSIETDNTFSVSKAGCKSILKQPIDAWQPDHPLPVVKSFGENFDIEDSEPDGAIARSELELTKLKQKLQSDVERAKLEQDRDITGSHLVPEAVKIEKQIAGFAQSIHAKNQGFLEQMGVVPKKTLVTTPMGKSCYRDFGGDLGQPKVEDEDLNNFDLQVLSKSPARSPCIGRGQGPPRLKSAKMGTSRYKWDGDPGIELASKVPGPELSDKELRALSRPSSIQSHHIGVRGTKGGVNQKRTVSFEEHETWNVFLRDIGKMSISIDEGSESFL